MGRLFGTDGIRGIANTELNCELAMKVGKSAAMVLTNNSRRRPFFVIGMDTRVSSGMLCNALVAVVFAKKTKSINLEGDMYTAEVESFTHKNKNQVIVAKKFINEDDHVLLIDDFLANGCALQGLIQIVQSAGGTVEGIGIAIEKGFQTGGKIIRNLGYQLESLAIVDAMNAETGEIVFREQ